MFALRDALAQAEGYDFVLIDCPPSLDLIVVNAMLTSTEIALPVPCQFLGGVGAAQFAKLAAELADTSRAALQWVIPTFYRHTKLSDDILEALGRAFGDRVTPSVRLAVAIDEATRRGQTVFEHKPDSNVAADYEAVARRIDNGW